MKARLPPVPAKTMSRGSSPTSSVRTTRESVGSDGVDRDDADAVREVVHDPHLGVAAGGDGHRLEADHHRGDAREPRDVHVEDVEPVVGRVDGEQPRPVRRERERPHVAALEVVEAQPRRPSRSDRASARARPNVRIRTRVRGRAVQGNMQPPRGAAENVPVAGKRLPVNRLRYKRIHISERVDCGAALRRVTSSDPTTRPGDPGYATLVGNAGKSARQ